MTRSTRPTIRCLQDDLGLPLPPITEPLDGIGHELLDDSRRPDDTPTERISSIDDQVLLKAKPGGSRWRGALWNDNKEEQLAWLVAAGIRRDGDRSDFYADLSTRCARERTRRNAAGTDLRPGKKTFSEHLLPTGDDRQRLLLERETSAFLQAQQAIPDLVHRARQQPGAAQALHALGTDIEAFVYHQPGSFDELYLMLVIRGSAPPIAHILRLAAPELTVDDWGVLETPPHRPGAPGEIVYYGLLEVPDLHAAPNPADRAEDRQG